MIGFIVGAGIVLIIWWLTIGAKMISKFFDKDWW